jgi:hypothetical protein
MSPLGGYTTVWYSKGPGLEPGVGYSEVSHGFMGHSTQISGY